MRLLVISSAILLAAPVQAQSADPRIRALIDSVSADRLAATVRALEGFGTRNSLSDTVSSTRGIGAARRWIARQFQESSPKLQVTFDCYQVPPAGRITREVQLCNVMAVLPGRSTRRIYVSGHYDTVVLRRAGGPAGGRPASTADQPAPGANDDGSGTALVIELARVFAQSGIEFDATLGFIGFAGEEQGLIGARRHAEKAAAARWTIDAVFNNDIVGGSVGGNGRTDSRTVRVFSEGPEDSPSRQLARYIREAAARYVPAQTVRLLSRHDRFGRGGDHTAFNQQGFAGVRFTESTENYSRQHTVDDTFSGIDPGYLARNAQVNAAAMASLALAPVAPVVQGERGPTLGRGQGGYDAALRWRPSPGAARYRVVWREAWTPDWQFSRLVQDTTVTLRDVSIDDYVFGVAAIGPGGHESLVAPYVLAPRR